MAVILDILTVVILIALAPILLAILLLVCAFPILDRLLHPRREYMDGISSAYINHIMEAVIHGLVTATERKDADSVFEAFDKTYVSTSRPEFARFKQRVVKRDWLWPYWTDASANFDRNHHFRVVKDPLTKEGLEQRLAQIQTDIMDIERPLWELWHFENFTDVDGKASSVTMLRMHHAVADGFTGMRVIMQGAQPNKPPAEVVQSRGDRRPRLGLCQLVRYWLRSIRKLLLMQDDKPSTFKATTRLTPTARKVVTWNELKAANVADLKALGKELNGATINDILISALAGALRKYTETTPDAGLPADLTACTWVSLSPLKHIYTDFDQLPLRWGNSTLGAVYIKLPIGPDHGQCSTHETMELLRKSTGDPALMLEAGTATKLLSMMGWLPRLAAAPVWGPLANKVSVSMSNVPGPQFPLEWCSVPVRNMMFFVPPTGTISLFVTIATWDGQIIVGMGVDGTLMSQEALSSIAGELFEAEIRQLQQKVPPPV